MIETIKKRGDFLLVAAKGKKVVTPSLILQTLARPAEHPAGTHTRYGFTVTRKMGNAVKRNRIKRRLRAAVREVAERHALAGCDYVMIPRHKALACPFGDILRDMEFAFLRISSMKDGKPVKTPSPGTQTS